MEILGKLFPFKTKIRSAGFPSTFRSKPVPSKQSMRTPFSLKEKSFISLKSKNPIPEISSALLRLIPLSFEKFSSFTSEKIITLKPHE